MLECLVGKRRLSGLALALALGGSGVVSCGSEPVKTPPGMGVVDSDGDGMPDEMERQMGTNPLKQDSDNDGFDDLYEVQHGTDPMNPDDPPKNNPDAGSLDAMVEEFDSGRHPDAQLSDTGYDAETPDAGFQDSGERDAGASMYPICRVGGPYEVRVYEFFDLDLVALGSYDP
ncbi:MAG TPA: thrombospondin type 3 repeat-containing protein, partial [Candidatus Nanoarchaeia archaeon]|nr:thrombospondin type 3 repeat-containing protein [Candidatus Nanoarchaeia archaeon]